MPANSASVLRSASNTAWSFARSVNAILPNGRSPAAILGARPTSQKLGKNANGEPVSLGRPSHSAQNAIEKQQTP